MVRLLTSTGWSNKTITETAYEQGLKPHEPRRVHGVKGPKSLRFSKRFENEPAQERWHEKNAGNVEIHHVVKEDFFSEEEQNLLEMFDITEEELPDLIEALEVIDDAVEEYRRELFAEAGLDKLALHARIDAAVRAAKRPNTPKAHDTESRRGSGNGLNPDNLHPKQRAAIANRLGRGSRRGMHEEKSLESHINYLSSEVGLSNSEIENLISTDDLVKESMYYKMKRAIRKITGGQKRSIIGRSKEHEKAYAGVYDAINKANVGTTADKADFATLAAKHASRRFRTKYNIPQKHLSGQPKGTGIHGDTSKIRSHPSKWKKD